MKLSLYQNNNNNNNRPISHIEYPDSAVIGAVSFWANVQHQSPQFPLDLNPRFHHQLNTLYKGNQIPIIENTTFEVSSDQDSQIKMLEIVQLKIRYVGTPDHVPTPDHIKIPRGITTPEVWGEWFETNAHWSFSPDGSAYITPTKERPNKVSIQTNKPTSSEYLSYDVLVAFQIEGEIYMDKNGKHVPKTFYANFDPLAKVTSNT